MLHVLGCVWFIHPTFQLANWSSVLFHSTTYMYLHCHLAGAPLRHGLPLPTLVIFIGKPYLLLGFSSRADLPLTLLSVLILVSAVSAQSWQTAEWWWNGEWDVKMSKNVTMQSWKTQFMGLEHKGCDRRFWSAFLIDYESSLNLKLTQNS